MSDGINRSIAPLLILAVASATSAVLVGQVLNELRPLNPAASVKRLTRAEFDDLLAQPAEMLVLDVRRPEEIGSIGGFPVYLSVQVADLETRLDWIPRDRRIVTVSNRATSAARAAHLLTNRGFAVAGAIGAQDYERDGGTLLKTAAHAPREPRARAGREPSTAMLAAPASARLDRLPVVRLSPTGS